MKMTLKKAFVVNEHTHLLAVIVFLLLSSPSLDSMHPKFPIMSGLFLLALMFILRTLHLSRRMFGSAAVFGGLSFISQLGNHCRKIATSVR